MAQQRDELEQQLDEVRQQIAAIQERIDHDLGQRDALLQQLADAEREAGRARRARDQTRQAMDRTRQRITGLEAEGAMLEARVAEQAGLLGRQLTTAYRLGRQSRLKMLLNQDDPRLLSRRLAYHGYLSRARASVMTSLNESIGRLAASRQSLETELQALDALLAEQQRDSERLEQALARRSQALASIDQRVQGDRERLAELEDSAAELAALIARLSDALADIPPEIAVPGFGELRGRLPMPVTGALRQQFGDPRGGELEWTGWLIGAPAGRDVRAIAHGRVAYADWLRGYGLLLIIDHGDEFMSLYAHNDSLRADVGDWVAPADVIASVGQTGGVADAGLYFEIRRSGQPLDPAEWIER